MTKLRPAPPLLAGRHPPPTDQTGVIGWLRGNLFSSWSDTALTLLGVYIVYSIAVPFVDFVLVRAVWDGPDRSVCVVPEAGACWAYIKAKFGQFMYGRYPADERWRIHLTYALGAGLLAYFLNPKLSGKRLGAIALFVIYPLVAYMLLTGGIFGLAIVETRLWGGLFLTLVVAATGIAAAIPLGVLLALGRRSEMPVIRAVSILFIEFWRGVPLVTVLFMASVMLPLFLPEGVAFDKLLRALIGVALFAAAYIAETVRGGLQAIPKGQFEAAEALGLTYWQTMRKVILPQALKHAFPSIVNSCISLLKDTTLVSIIGLFDLLNVTRQSLEDPKWATPVTGQTGLVFAGLIFWVLCFSMSRYAAYLESYLRRGDAERRI